jgi:hypothetical protein
MPVLPILQVRHGNPPGDPDHLTTPAREVTDFSPPLRQLAADLLDTLRHHGAAGIAAPHVGVPFRVAVVEQEGGEFLVLVNPRIEGGPVSEDFEGCLSPPRGPLRGGASRGPGGRLQGPCRGQARPAGKRPHGPGHRPRGGPPRGGSRVPQGDPAPKEPRVPEGAGGVQRGRGPLGTEQGLSREEEARSGSSCPGGKGGPLDAGGALWTRGGGPSGRHPLHRPGGTDHGRGITLRGQGVTPRGRRTGGRRRSS